MALIIDLRHSVLRSILVDTFRLDPGTKDRGSSFGSEPAARSLPYRPASGSPASNVVAELTPKRVRQIALLKFDRTFSWQAAE